MWFARSRIPNSCRGFYDFFSLSNSRCNRALLLNPELTRLGRPGNDLLSRVLRRSTIGAGAFHGRVRNGIGCSHPAIITRSAETSYLLAHGDSRSGSQPPCAEHCGADEPLKRDLNSAHRTSLGLSMLSYAHRGGDASGADACGHPKRQGSECRPRGGTRALLSARTGSVSVTMSIA